ncbi:MucR family transcriptional regulator [Neoaquamicrobium sediminum]|uniref:MucR family transcriptional regulator n=1 Tax=Neoaquamicrobium sediminum TaxID=1849104 RepID=UPI00361E75D3
MEKKMPMNEQNGREQLTSLTARIVSAYVSSSPVPANELAALILAVHASLSRLRARGRKQELDSRKPAVPIRNSVHDDHLVCLEDGKKFKTLKRHLNEIHGLTPEEYRRKWDLPFDYPMISPNYAAERSEFSRSRRLGHKRLGFRKLRP